MPARRRTPRVREPASSDELRGLALFGYVSAHVLAFIWVLLNATRYGVLIKGFVAIMAVLAFIAAWAYWGAMMFVIAGWLGIRFDASMPLTTVAGVVVVLLCIGPPLVVGSSLFAWYAGASCRG